MFFFGWPISRRRYVDLLEEQERAGKWLSQGLGIEALQLPWDDCNGMCSHLCVQYKWHIMLNLCLSCPVRQVWNDTIKTIKAQSIDDCHFLGFLATTTPVVWLLSVGSGFDGDHWKTENWQLSTISKWFEHFPSKEISTSSLLLVLILTACFPNLWWPIGNQLIAQNLPGKPNSFRFRW